MKRLLLALATMALALPATAGATPTVNFTITPPSPIQGQAVTFKSTSNCDRGPCTYKWTDPTDGQVFSTAKSFNFTYHGTGNRSVKLTVRNSIRQSASRTRSFVVQPANTPPPPPTDTDGDGIPDSSDQCPTQPGPASNNGCPVSPPPPPSGNNCMPTPSACGYPDISSTGTLPGVSRDTVSGNVTLSTPGQVYENKTVTGSITVTAANVTIRNVKVISGGWAIRCRPQDGNCSNLMIQDTEINLDGDLGGYGIVCENYTATRVFIHNGADGAYLCSNATVRDSLIALGPDANNDGWPDSNSFCVGSPQHFDGLSSDGGTGQVYDHNTIRNPCTQTSAILISTNSSAINSVKITNNLMAGGGYTLYCAATAGGTGGDPEVVTGNRIARTYAPQGGYYGPVAYCNTAATFSGNVWDDTGQTIGA